MKRCLVLQGGGVRAAFVASASAPTLAYFLAGQYVEGREALERGHSV